LDALENPGDRPERRLVPPDDEFSQLIRKGHYAGVFVSIVSMISDELEEKRTLSKELLNKVNSIRDQVFKVQSESVAWGRKEVADVLFAKAIERGNTRFAMMAMEWLTPSDRLKEEDPSHTIIMGFAERYSAIRKKEIKQRKDQCWFDEIDKLNKEERYEEALLLAETFIESKPVEDLQHKTEGIISTILQSLEMTKVYWSRAEAGLRAGDIGEAFSYAACVVRNNSTRSLSDLAYCMIKNLLVDQNGIEGIKKYIKSNTSAHHSFEYLVKKSHIFTKDEKAKINEFIDNLNDHTAKLTPSFGHIPAVRVQKIEIT
jgi:hypothetical protein